MRVSFIAAVCLAAFASAATAGHVVVIGVDGMSPAGIAAANTPNMDAIMTDGAYTMHARAVMPTSSSSNWASMIMGAGPEQHGITSNGWEPDEFEIAPTASGPSGLFPTMFAVIRDQDPNANLAVFYDWGGFGRLLENDIANVKQDCDGPDATVDIAVADLKDSKPMVTFIQLDHVDHAGHGHGWGSPEYVEAIEHADALVGRVVDAVRDAGIADDTVIIVTADHGGKGTGHGGDTMEEIEIPWMATGPGIQKHHEIAAPVNTYDTASTVIRILGLKQPEAWIAKPVVEAIK